MNELEKKIKVKVNFKRLPAMAITVALNHGRLLSWSEGKNNEILMKVIKPVKNFMQKSYKEEWCLLHVSEMHLRRLNRRESDSKDKVPVPKGFITKGD